MRADVYLHLQGLTESREKARALIMAGKVTADGKPVQKAGAELKEGAVIHIEDALPYVSRGGLKLKQAIDTFRLDLNGLTAADIGASTGGFTDCMLQEGAKKVYAIDVGYGQFDWRLRNDPRVALLERTNARNMEPEWFSGPLAFASIDVSFISIRLILPALHACLQDGGQAVALIKPQFEAGREEVSRHGGVIKDTAVHEAVCTAVLQHAAALGFFARGLCYSPITGPKGNIEFLALLEKGATGQDMPISLPIYETVQEAHHALKKNNL